MLNARIAQGAPENLVDYAGDARTPPQSWQPQLPSTADLAAIQKLLFRRTLLDPVNNWEFEANEMRDIYRFGWYRTNLVISLGKRKAVGQYEFDAGLMPPIVSPSTLFTGSDYAEFKHSLRFFVVTPQNKDDTVKMPKYLKAWHKDDLPILRQRCANIRSHLEGRIPVDVTQDFNIFQYNRHPLVAQALHRTAALTWQIMQTFEHAEGAKARELDAWSYVAAIEMAYAGEANGFALDSDLLRFVAQRIADLVNVDDFGPKGYQDYMLRNVFICFWLGEAEMGWDTACQISKLRGREFTKSPLYDCMQDMKNDPAKFSDLLTSNPRELLTFFRI